MRRKEEKQGPASRQRLNKVISSTGFCSRRRAEELIDQGRVSVNSKIITEQGYKVNTHEDTIMIDSKKLHVNADMTFRYYLLNKPSGYISSKADPQGRAIITDLLPKKLRTLNPVGRLDYNTEGIIIFTDDGNLVNKLTHPRYQVRRRYLVRARGIISEETFRETALNGTVVDGVKVNDIGFSGIKHTSSHTWFEIEIGEGKNREVKKIVQNMNAEVSRLKRIAYGTVYKNIPPKGKYRKLSAEEVSSLYELIKNAETENE